MASRLAVLAMYDGEGIVEDYLLYLLKEVHKNATYVVVVCNGNLCLESEKKVSKFANEIFYRKDEGFDVSAYKDVFENLFGWENVYKFDELLLINDSFYGPFCPMSKIFIAMEEKEVDFWGITEQVPLINPFGAMYDEDYLPFHIQPYFAVIRKNLLHSKVFRKFWKDLPLIRSYTDAVTKYELVFTKYFVDYGYNYDTYVDCKQFNNLRIESNYNYLLQNPYDLIVKYNCPIIKRKYFTQKYNSRLECFLYEDTKRVLEYIKNKTTYDVTLIWKNLIRCLDSTSLHYALQLRYILSCEVQEYENIISNKNITAIIACIDHERSLDYCCEYLEQVPQDIDIYVIAASEILAKELRGAIQNRQIIVINRQGIMTRDVLDYVKSIFGKYEYVCMIRDVKIGKRMEDFKIGKSHMYMLWDNMLKNSVYITNILALLGSEEKIGLLMAPTPYHTSYFSTIGDEWAGFYQKTKEWTEALHIKCSMCESIPPVSPSSVFWCRTVALLPVLEQIFVEEEWNEEKNYIADRIIQYAVASQGYATGVVMNNEYASLHVSNYDIMLTGMLNEISKKKKISSYRNYFLFDEKKLEDFVRGKEHIWIYGVGHFSEIITRYMLKEELCFDGYVISDDREKKKDFFGKKIYWLSEVHTKPEETGIILALDKEHQKQVRMNLKGKFENIFIMNGGMV